MVLNNRAFGQLLMVKFYFTLLFAFFSMQIVYAQNHYIILIDGGAKTRSHENIPHLKKLLFKTIPDILYEQGIRINHETIKAAANDKFSLVFFGLLSHRKIKHYGNKDLLQIRTLFPALKKVSLEKDFVHPTAIYFSKFKSKQQLLHAIRKELIKADTYWYGFATLSDYALYKILKNNNQSIQNTIIIILVKDIEFNSQGAASEISFAKEHLKDYNNTFAYIDKFLPQHYHKIELHKVNSGNIHAYFYNLYPKTQDSIKNEFIKDIIKRVIYNKKNSEDSLLQYSIVLNETYQNIKNQYKNSIDTSRISFHVDVDGQEVKTYPQKNNINFYLPIPDTLDKCALPSKKVNLTTTIFLKDLLTGIKKMQFKNPVSHPLPPYPTCQWMYWIIRGAILFLMLLLIYLASLYYIYRFRKTNLYYEILGKNSAVPRNKSPQKIHLNLNDHQLWLYYKPPSFILKKLMSDLAHRNMTIESQTQKYLVRDLLKTPTSIHLKANSNNIIEFKQKGKTFFKIEISAPQTQKND